MTSERDVTFLLSATAVDKRRLVLQIARQTRRIADFRSPRFQSERMGGRSDRNRASVERKERKLQFDDDALDLFVLLTGGDTRQIENELDKIDIYLDRERRV